MASIDKHKIKRTSKRAPIQGGTIAKYLGDSVSEWVASQLTTELTAVGEIELLCVIIRERSSVRLNIEVGWQIDGNDAPTIAYVCRKC
jgi:hypothetical protein